LEKLEAQDAQLKGQREEKIGLLYSIRDEMAKKRKALAESQVAAKGLELELSALKTQGKAAQEMKSSIEAVIKQIENYETQVKEKRQQLERMEKEIDKATAEKEQLGAQLAGLEAKSKSDTSESDRAYAALISRKSELAATVKGELAQQQLYSKQLSALLSQKEGFEKEQKEHKAKSKALEAEIEKNKKELARHEQELAEFSKAAEKHYLLAKELEAKIVEIGKKKGKMEYEAQQLQKAQQELEVKKAGVEARLPELKADYENYKGMPLLEHPREQLLAMVKESEARMAGLGNVNLMAPQLYEEKKKDIEEVKGKLDRLADEKSAVFAMIEEIESKKHAIFMDTFRAVSDNFKKIFGYIFKGDGMLVLEKPSDPFNGGLSIKINEGGKERYIESMSGGEKALLAIIFIFAIQTHKPSAFYILDEADAALDKENSKKLAQLLRQMSATTQFIVVTHNDAVLSGADVVLGVSKTQDGSQMVGIELTGRKGILAQEGQTTRQMEAPVEPKGQRKITASATGAGKKDSVKKSDSEKEDNEDSLDFEEEKLSED
ncbi:hypothetical protein FJZ26_04510, partial [Candidatus Parvarchaeota archaeon]|nr:hypothetical protein [Candidatus Parvarchaeota archaeon]